MNAPELLDDLAPELVLAEEELRSLAARLLAGAGEQADEDLLRAHPDLADELVRRLEAVGARVVRAEGQPPLIVVSQPSEELSELALSCLALCALDLAGDSEGRRRPRVTVRKVWEQVGRARGYTEAYVRRAGLGPLEARQMIKVIKPEQRASDAYVVAGVAMRAIDADLLRRRLRELKGHQG